jgi:hypothetical protein
MCTPQLWTSISMRFSESQCDGQLSLLRTLCERSRTLPISITLFGSPNKSIQSSLIALTPYTQRIEAMRLSISRACLQYLRDHPMSLPSLKTCNISFLEDLENENLPVPRPSTLFNNSQDLRHLVVSGFLPKIKYLPAHVHSLDLGHGITLSQCCNVMLQCPRLEHFACAINHPLPFYHNTNSDITLRDLFSLSITVDSIGSSAVYFGDPFFARFTMPSLSMFRIRFKRRTMWRPLAFNDLIRRSSCLLQCLSLNSMIFRSYEFGLFLRDIPSLIDLHMEGCSGDLALQVLTFSGPNNLVPNLQTFVAERNDYSTGPVNTIDEEFATMVE